MHQTLSSRRLEIVFAGGGVAALEALLALRQLLGSLPEISLIAPQPELSCPPVAVASSCESRGRADRDSAREVTLATTRANGECRECLALAA